MVGAPVSGWLCPLFATDLDTVELPYRPAFRRGSIVTIRGWFGYDLRVRRRGTPRGGRSMRLGRQFRLRTLMMAVALAGVGMWAIRDPIFSPIVLSLLMVIGALTLNVILVFGLGWLIGGLFALGERVVGWAWRVSRRPDKRAGGHRPADPARAGPCVSGGSSGSGP